MTSRSRGKKRPSWRPRASRADETHEANNAALNDVVELLGAILMCQCCPDCNGHGRVVEMREGIPRDAGPCRCRIAAREVLGELFGGDDGSEDVEGDGG